MITIPIWVLLVLGLLAGLFVFDTIWQAIGQIQHAVWDRQRKRQLAVYMDAHRRDGMPS